MKFFLSFLTIHFLIFCGHGIADESRVLIPSSSLAGTEGLVDGLVNNSVCVITGSLLDNSTDIVLPGPDPLVLGRT